MSAIVNNFFTATLEASATSTLIVDVATAGFPVIYANSAVHTLSGYDRAGLIGQPWHFFQGAQTNKETLFAVTDSLSTHKTVSVILQLHRRNGEMFWCHVQSAPVVLEPPTDRYAVITLQDISAHMQREQALKQANDRAVEATQMKSRFLAMMSHEIRTPLNGIAGTLQLLADTALMPDQRQLVDLALHSSHLLADIINDVLDFSKLESGKMVLRPQVFNLHALAHEIMDMFRADAERRRLSLQLDLHHDLPPHVVGDAQRIRQIILNLISNALKFTPRGSVTLRLLPLLQQKNGAHDEVIVRFIVHDTGIGISPSDQTKLFSEYHQLGETYRGKTEGTGLGLAICRQLVHLMKGEIGLESRVGEGTKFWFVLPMQVVSQARAHAVHNIASTEPVPRTILLVEDTETNLLIAQSMLQKMGQRLVVARDGLEAVEKAKTHDIDMVLMDVMMPRMDGMTATQHLRAEGYDGPIIAMTALVTPEDRDKCLAAGMNDFISKPLKMADLKTCLIQHQAQTML